MRGNNIPTAAAMLEDVYNIQYAQACNKVVEVVKSVALKSGTNVCIKLKFFADNTPLIDVDELIDELNIKGYTVTKNNNEIVIDWSKAQPLGTFNPYSQIHPQTTVGKAEIC